MEPRVTEFWSPISSTFHGGEIHNLIGREALPSLTTASVSLPRVAHRRLRFCCSGRPVLRRLCLLVREDFLHQLPRDLPLFPKGRHGRTTLSGLPPRRNEVPSKSPIMPLGYLPFASKSSFSGGFSILGFAPFASRRATEEKEDLSMHLMLSEAAYICLYSIYM